MQEREKRECPVCHDNRHSIENPDAVCARCGNFHDQHGAYMTLHEFELQGEK
jgi:hypothetical protein